MSTFPSYIKQTVAYRSGQIPTADEINSYFNLLIEQGDLTTTAVDNHPAYVARYVLKKVTGSDDQDHYKGRVPEYVTMSRKPGIAYDWFRRYSSDIYPNDFVIIS